MIIKKHGLELREVEREDLELIRQFRNSKVIKNKMIYTKQISREEQLQWFEKIRTVHHFYFLIYKDDSAIGLINGKNIDYDEKSSEGGIFLWNEDRNYEISITASVILNDWHFFINNFNCNYAQVLKTNKQAVAYNEFMGYRIAEKVHINPDVLWMIQNRQDYIDHRHKLGKLSFSGLKIDDKLTESDIFIQEHEKEYAKKLLLKLPESQQDIYKRILARST